VDLVSVGWVILSGLLFGSQFVPSKYCPDFDKAAYNITMAVGILLGSVVFLVILGGGISDGGTALFGIASGAVWVAGNFCLIIAVAEAGMARAFTIINLTAVFSFIGGGAVLGELGGYSTTGIGIMIGAIALVIMGSVLVGGIKKTDGEEGGGNKKEGERKKDPDGKDADGIKMDEAGADNGKAGKGVMFAFISTLFFALYNVMAAYMTNHWGTSTASAFILISPGILIGAMVIAALPKGASLGKWKGAPGKWHGLALVQGIIWSIAMVSIMIGWKGTGIAIGTPVQLGTQTIVSALWGILFFGEFKELDNKKTGYARFAAGAALAVSGIALMAML
jgi:glucose uptake protein GlcU